MISIVYLYIWLLFVAAWVIQIYGDGWSFIVACGYLFSTKICINFRKGFCVIQWINVRCYVYIPSIPDTVEKHRHHHHRPTQDMDDTHEHIHTSKHISEKLKLDEKLWAFQTPSTYYISGWSFSTFSHICLAIYIPWTNVYHFYFFISVGSCSLFSLARRFSFSHFRRKRKTVFRKVTVFIFYVKYNNSPSNISHLSENVYENIYTSIRGRGDGESNGFWKAPTMDPEKKTYIHKVSSVLGWKLLKQFRLCVSVSMSARLEFTLVYHIPMLFCAENTFLKVSWKRELLLV